MEYNKNLNPRAIAPKSIGLSRKLGGMILCLVLIFVVVQFVKLATVGRMGSEISEVKNEQEKLELENERLRAEISKFRASSYIEPILKEDLRLRATNVILISNDEIVAHN